MRAGASAAGGLDADMPKVLISDITPGQDVNTAFLVREKELRKTRGGKSFLSLKLADRSGELVGRVWDGAENLFDSIPRKGVVTVQARAELFREELQLNVQGICPVAPEEIDPADFMPVCPRDTEFLFQELKQTLGLFRRKPLGLLMKRFLADGELMGKFTRAPAAKTMHHAYLGGLLEHTLGVCKVALMIADHYEALDRDLLLAGAFLHDLGKVDEFVYELDIDYSHAGRLLGHMVLGVQLLEEKIKGIKNFPPHESMLLKHMVLSHHGETALGAVRLPMTREAVALHFADDLDAKMNSLSRILEDNKTGNEFWTGYQPLFERFFLRGFPPDVHSPAASGNEQDRAVQLCLWSGRKDS